MNYPGLLLVIQEMITSQAIKDLDDGRIDGAILATPLNEARLCEHPLYYERFIAYVSEKEDCYTKEPLEPKDIDAGMTIIPEMAIQYLRGEQKAHLRPFIDPAPEREISLVTRKDFIRRRIVKAFQAQTTAVLPAFMTSKKLRSNRDSIPAH